jgi:hypothetical protein
VTTPPRSRGVGGEGSISLRRGPPRSVKRFQHQKRRSA